MLRSKFLLFLSLIILFSCGEDCPQLIDSYCFSFDVRTCQGDLFSDEVDISDPKDKRESDMRTWLEKNGYAIDDIKLVLDYTTGDCEACNVCPMGDRYFVQANGPTITSYEEMQLLNVETEDCCGLFE